MLFSERQLTRCGLFGVGDGELVGAVEGWAGAEIDVVVLVWVEDSFETSLWRDIDRSRRKPDVLVGIVWRVNRKMLLQDTV